MSSFNVRKYELPSTRSLGSNKKSTPSKKKGLFIKGPIGLDWLHIAGRLPGKSLHVACALWYAQGVERQTRFKFTPKWYDGFYVSPATVRRSLQRLEQAGLIRVEHRPGRAPVVRILTAPEED